MTQDSFVMELDQMSPRSSPRDSDPQIQLLTALFDNDYPRFEELVTHGAVDLEYIYKHPDEKTCLEFAVSEPNKLEYVKLLLQHKVEVNNVNKFKGFAPIHFAADNGNIEALKVLLEDDRIDVNNECTIDNDTALLIVITKMLYINDLVLTTYEDIVELLLKAGCNANSRNTRGETPMYLAANQGLKRVINLILENVEVYIDILVEPVNSMTLLQATVRGMVRHGNTNNADFNWCLDFFLKYSKINHQDKDDNTALHYAARSGDNELVLNLLQHGACVSLRNKLNVPPLEYIDPKILVTYLDECITTNYKTSDQDYQIRMNYKFLTNKSCSIRRSKNVTEWDDILAPETDALLYMTQNEELRPLLKHPVITSFLYLKWQRISYLAYVNITFYSLLCLCLILFIINGYCVQKKQSDSVEVLNIVTYVGVIIGFILLIFRELFQLLLSPMRYLQGYDNWMEIVLIGIIAWIIFYDSAQVSTKQQLSAIAILISSAELLLLIGQFPESSINILMLKTVSRNFFKFLLWYCILIVAFALSFYTLFREVEDDHTLPPQNLNSTEKEESEEFFDHPLNALFKTIVMLTGEFDTGTIKFNKFPVLSRIIFIMFVFMIPIVLFNLLNGLAVSDTQKIRADAELSELISRVELISYFESVLLENPKASKKPTKSRSWLTRHLQDMNTCILNFKTFCVKPLAKRICLFPYFLPEYEIIVRPNQDNRIWIPRCNGFESYRYTECNTTCGNGCFGRYQIYKLDNKIVQNAKIVIRKHKDVTEFDEIKDTFFKYETKIENLETKIVSFAEIKSNVANVADVADVALKYETRFDNLETKIESLETKIESLDTTLNAVLQTLERMSA